MIQPESADRAKATELVRLVLLENLRWEMVVLATEGAIITSETEAAVIVMLYVKNWLPAPH